MAMLVITRWYIQQTSAGLLLPPLRKLQASGVIRKVAGFWRVGDLAQKSTLSTWSYPLCDVFLREFQRKYVYIYIIILYYMM
jgi:hypothetical protein